jgi:nitrite reductase/ring-hydroxylating ferredoxin subunit
MVTRAPFLTTRFGGYYHRDIPAEDVELTHIGPDTPCGEYFRRFWQPVCFSDELRDLPRRIKILGEELVVFRDRSGAVGLLELHCPHRGTSLEFGLVGAKGIRCCYHGWLFDVDGAILETPGEPADSTLKDRLCHGAYPTHEAHGIVFAYLGPPDERPPFPTYDSLIRPSYRVIPGQKYFIRATGCRSWKTRWIPPIRRFSTRSSAAPISPRNSACCRSWTSSRPRWG